MPSKESFNEIAIDEIHCDPDSYKPLKIIQQMFDKYEDSKGNNVTQKDVIFKNIITRDYFQNLQTNFNAN